MPNGVTSFLILRSQAFGLLFVPTVGTALLYLMRTNLVNVVQLLLAWFLLSMPWCSYLYWKETRQILFPIFAVIAVVHWLYFVPPLFLGDTFTLTLGGSVLLLTEETFTQALSLAVAGIFFLWLGMSSKIGRRWSITNNPDLIYTPIQQQILRLILLFGSLSAYLPLTLLGQGGRQLLILVQTTVPFVAFVILLRQYLQGRSAKLDKLCLVLFIFIRLVIGLSSGWVGGLLDVGIVCLVAYTIERNKLPILLIILAAAYILFFQAGKQTFREQYWYGASSTTSPVERISLWVDASYSGIAALVVDENYREEAIRQYFVQSFVMRTALLQQTGNVMEVTPAVVPYQQGQTYEFLLVSLIPRAFWPDKPSANEANRFYQVAYGLNTEEQLDTVSIAVGFLTESYINFGWFGVIGIMFMIGIFLDYLQYSFLTNRSGALLGAIGIVMLVQLFKIEAQLGTYLGGLLQQTLAALALFLPIASLNRDGTSAAPG